MTLAENALIGQKTNKDVVDQSIKPSITDSSSTGVFETYCAQRTGIYTRSYQQAMHYISEHKHVRGRALAQREILLLL